MTEWWTYRPSDFLMYSPRSWGRLLEGLHEELWPAQIVVVLVAATALARAWRRPRETTRAIAGVLALASAWIAWDFYWTRLAQISTGAPWFTAAAAAQAVLLAVLGTREPSVDAGKAARTVGLSLATLALVVWPLLAPATGRGWKQAELPGLTADATALFTVGLLLALPLRFKVWLLPIPLALLAIGVTMQWLLFVR